MFILRKKSSRNRFPLDLLSRKSVRREASSRRRGNGGASRKLVIIGMSFFSISKPKRYGVDGALEGCGGGKAVGFIVLERAERRGGNSVKLYSFTSTSFNFMKA